MEQYLLMDKQEVVKLLLWKDMISCLLMDFKLKTILAELWEQLKLQMIVRTLESLKDQLMNYLARLMNWNRLKGLQGQLTLDTTLFFAPSFRYTMKKSLTYWIQTQLIV